MVNYNNTISNSINNNNNNINNINNSNKTWYRKRSIDLTDEETLPRTTLD